jgi:microcystin degradation protein MlrC
MDMRIAIASISQETASFTPVPTTLDDFRHFGLYEGDEVLKEVAAAGPLAGFMHAVEEEGVDLVPLPIIQARAGAGGIITAKAYDYFHTTVVQGLQRALPLDGFWFAQHGAAVSQEVEDMEGHLLQAAREVVGPDVPIVMPCDHHANITRRIVDHADAVVGHRTQPHDQEDTGYQAAKLLFAIIRGDLRPTTGWCKIPIITHQEQFLTRSGPMKEWFDLAREMETRTDASGRRVASASCFPMQPWLDVAEGGWSSLVITNDDPELAHELAAELADKAWSLREAFTRLSSVSPAEAIRRAVAAERGLVVISDTGDAVFGGGPGDSTILLAEMLRQRIPCTALVPMVDPEAVAVAWQAGVDAEVTVAVGGKRDNLFSQPVEVTGRVAALAEGWLSADVVGLGAFDMGRSALLEVGPIKLVVSEFRGVGGNHPVVYRRFGIEPAEAKMVVLKTASNFQYYADLTSEVIRADTPGLTMSHLEQLPWRNLPRPIYPLDELPEWRAP